MRAPARTALAVGLLVAAGGLLPAAAPAAGPKPASAVKWEYRALTKEQLLELGQKDLAAGLNRLGSEGWELVTVQQPSASERGPRRAARSAEFYFKRAAATKAPPAAPPAPPARAEFKTFILRNANATQSAKVLRELLGDKEGRQLRLTADERTNMVLASGAAVDLEIVEVLLIRLDQPTPKAR
jgi:hypothetical protein